MAYEELKPSGVTANTPKNIVLGAGTIHKGLKLTGSAWNFAESLIGATAGGNKLTITSEAYTIEPDGALVKMKGLDVKIGESATLEVNFLELTEENILMMTGGEKASQSAYTGYNEILSKGGIAEGDYLENLAFVGKKTDGTPIIVIFENARCTSGFTLDGKTKENTTFPATFECYADVSDNADKLPWHILMPTA